jgi:hypothetical protein
MHEKVSPWANGLTDEDLAYALLGLGLLPSRLYRQPKVALQAIAASLKEDEGLAYRWRLDLLPSTPKAWSELPPAAEVAQVVAGFSGKWPLRFAMLQGSVLSTWKAWEFIHSTLSSDRVATHIVCAPSNRPVRFRWPLRIGFLPGPNAAGDVEKLMARDVWDRNVYAAAVLSRRNPECDVLVCIDRDKDVGQTLQRASQAVGGIRADVLAVFSGAIPSDENTLSRLEELRGVADAGGIALLGAKFKDPADLIRWLCIELSHNQTLDVALSRSSGGEALLLASQQLLDASRLEAKALNLATAMASEAQAKVALDPTKLRRWARIGVPEPVLAGSRGSGMGIGRGSAGPRSPPRRSAPRRSAPRRGGVRAVLPGPDRDMSQAAESPAMEVVRARPVRAKPKPPTATRGHVARYLRRSVRDFGWHQESDEASDLGAVMRTLADDDKKIAGARYLQAGFATEKKAEEPYKGILKRETNYFVNVFVGQERRGYARGNVTFPDLPPPDDGRSHELEVVFWEPRLCKKPKVQKIDLPPLGSSNVCQFPIRTLKTTKEINARITVLHRNRVLQTGTLKKPVGRKGELKFTLDAIPRRILNGLDQRTNFSMAMVLNDMDGKGAVHVMSGGKAQTFKTGGKAMENLETAISSAISDITSDPANYQGIHAPGSEELMLELAAKGAGLREYLERHWVKGGKLLTPDFVQLVSTKPDEVFPLEFIYDWTAPDLGAKVCPNAVAALKAGDCLPNCARHSNPASMDQTICPFGFWGIRCVIERKLRDNKTEAERDEVGSLEPVSPDDGPLKPLTSVLVGASPKADASVPDSVAGMLKRIRKIDSKAEQVTEWAKWPGSVARAKPSTLALVVHQEPDRRGTPLIEIGPPPLLSSDFLHKKYVMEPGSKSPPIVLLIGCETGKASVRYESFAVRFQWRGAAQVVSTIAEVVGRQAAPMAADILEAIQKVKEPTSFAVVMRDLRRHLLAQGTPMVLSLISDGDADWEVVGS